MKRFIATEVWQKDWFQALTPGLKCLWNYLCSNCDGAGVWDANWRMASFCIGETFDATSLGAFAGRVEILPNGKVWIVGFCEFQYGQLSRDCRGQNHVFRALEKHGLLDRVSHLLPHALDTLSDRVLDRDKDKDKEEEKEPDRNGAVGKTDPPADREMTAEEIGAAIGKIFKTARKPGGEAMHAIAAAMPVRQAELADLEKFYALPSDPSNPRLSRRTNPTNLAVSLADELVKARDFLRHINGQESPKIKRCL